MGGIESIRLGGDYQSRFGQYSLPDLLIGLLRGNLTGVLEVDLGTNKSDRIYFRDGVPVCVLLPSLGVSLSEVLISCGEIDRGLGMTVQRAARELAQSESVVFGKTDACPDGALHKGMRIRARSEVVKLFDTGDKPFRFSEGVPLPDLAEVTILQPLPLIYEGLLSAQDRTPVRMFLERTRGQMFRLVDTYPKGVDAFEWGEKVESVVQTMSDARTIEELSEAGLPLDQVAVVLTTLSLTGMIEALQGVSQLPQKLKLRTMATSGEHALPSEVPLKLRPISGVVRPASAPESEALTPAIEETNDGFREKIFPLIGKNYYVILRVTPASKPEQLERAVRFLSKNTDPSKRGAWALAELAREAYSVLTSPELAEKYRECVERSGEHPKYVSARCQMEVAPKLERALKCILEWYLDEADLWLSWIATLDPARSDLRIHRAFLSFCRTDEQKRPGVANALRDLLAQETMKAPDNLVFQIYLACVVATLGDNNMVQLIQDKRGVSSHPFAALIKRFHSLNSGM